MLPRKEKVMLYTAVPRLFRTTYIGYLYEISQKFPSILVAEKLDLQSEKAIRNKKWFPHLEKVVWIDQYTGKKKGLWESHRHFSALAKKIIDEYKPDIVMGGSIVNSFEKYLFRYAQLSGATTVAIQAGFQVSSWKTYNQRNYLLWRDTPKNLNLPIFVRDLKLAIVKIQQHLKELTDFWFIPLMMGTYPFYNKSLFHLGIEGWVREFDYSVVFSDKEVKVEKLSGRAKDKIIMLSHPLLRKSRDIFEKAYHLSKIKSVKTSQKSVTIMVDVNTYGHRRENFKIISESEYLNSRVKVINLVANILSDWKIFIKPHPTTKKNNFSFLKDYFEKHTRNISVVDPMDPADKYIALSDVIIGFPTLSTSLLTTMYQDPGKIIIYADLFQEILADESKIYPLINTVESMEQLEHLLIGIRSNVYKQKKLELPKYQYQSTVDVLEKILTSQKNNK